MCFHTPLTEFPITLLSCHPGEKLEMERVLGMGTQRNYLIVI